MSETCSGTMRFVRRDGDYEVYECSKCTHTERRYSPLARPTTRVPRDLTAEIIDDVNMGKAPDEAYDDPAYRSYIDWRDPGDPLDRRKMPYNKWRR